MKSQTSLVATNVRLNDWALQIRDCMNRPAGMDIPTWCAKNGITKANYYYHLRRVIVANRQSIMPDAFFTGRNDLGRKRIFPPLYSPPVLL